MSGASGLLTGLVVVIIGLAGLGFALAQMMTHADPNSLLYTAAGLVTFVVAALASLAIIR
ncbi:MAG TPA: hypothetical protein VFF87_13040 [Hyphomicrobium sp.]|nr:hypothetical protein [Hyphomicrobium sp.]